MVTPLVLINGKCWKTVFVLYCCFVLCRSTTVKNLFSTVTSYKWALPEVETSFTEDDLHNLPEFTGMSCSAAHTTVVSRHGSRFPGLEDVKDIIDLHRKLVASMEPDTNVDLYNWKSKFPSNNNKALAHTGKKELQSLGTMVAKRLATLFADEDVSKFRFITSSKERAKQSASAFFEGFIKSVQIEEEADEFDSEVNDELLRFFDLCSRYLYDVRYNKTAMKEFYSFMESPYIKKIQSKIALKLGVNSDFITTAQVRLIYIICGFEEATYGQSPWCSLLDDEDLIPLEYLGDLKQYYKNGYGYNITWMQSCPLMSEIFLTMDAVISEIESTEDDKEIEGYIVGQFAFGHAETLGPLLSALGLFNDSEPLKADNFESQADRAFVTSKILPFGANVIFVLYECVAEEIAEDEIDEAQYYLKVLVNEQPVLLPGCSTLYCDYNVIKRRYHTLIDSCNLKKLCKRRDPRGEL